ncbi:MAG TPA: hypothetical protein VFI11_05845 [Anaerolineales bacterium]|nr:hypothetical protein [Anaerolineales bacterium]
MEGNSLEKKLAWMDEQRRKDAEAIRRLTERVEASEESASKLSRQIQDLSTELARLAALATRIHKLDETLTKHRTEVARQTEASEARRSERDRQLEQVRRKDHDDHSKAIAEIRHRTEALDELRRIVDARGEEEVRIARTLAATEKRLDQLQANDEERARALEAQEQLHRQEARRVSEVGGEIAEVRNRAESLHGNLDHFDDRIRALEIRQAEIESAEGERREAQNVFLDQQNVRMVEFERLWKDYSRRIDAFEVQSKELSERGLAYEETHRSMKLLQGELDKALERMARNVNEIVEMQRVAEERHKQDWAVFRTEDQKRWGAFKMAHDERWREHERFHEKQSGEMEQLERTAAQALQEAVQLGDLVQRKIAELFSLLREWTLEGERPTGRVR